MPDNFRPAPVTSLTETRQLVIGQDAQCSDGSYLHFQMSVDGMTITQRLKDGAEAALILRTGDMPAFYQLFKETLQAYARHSKETPYAVND